MKKSILLATVLCALAALLAGCAAGTANSLRATATPAVTSTPQITAAPAATARATASPAGDNGAMSSAMNSESPAADAMTPAQAGRLAERIAEAVERISEIDDAEVVVKDERALVAVEFEEQYKAGLDERMKTQITQAVQKIDDSLTKVEITDDGTLYGQVKSLAERIGKATGFDELADDISDLFGRVTGM